MINIDNPNKHLETDGTWTHFGGSDFLVANTDNFKFQKLFARLQFPYRKKIDKGTLDPKIALDIMCESLATAVVLDWKNVTNNDGEQVPFSDEMCKLALKNNSDLRKHIQEYASEIENYQEADREELGKS